MSASASAELCWGVPFADIGRLVDEPRTLTRFDPDTGDKLIVKYEQCAVYINDQLVPDAPQGKDSYQWVDGGYGNQYWRKGTKPNLNLQRYLKKVGWQLPAARHYEEQWCSRLLHFVGIIVPTREFRLKNASIHDTTNVEIVRPDVMEKTRLMMVANLKLLKIAAEPQLALISYVS